MGKGRPRAVERGGLGQSSNASSTGSLNLPLAPVYYPNEEEFKDPLEFLEKIRAEAEPYGICKIVPPENWKPPFALDLNSFTFPTKTQAIHQLQVRPASCDSKTFDLEYDRFLEANGGKRPRKKVLFEGDDLDFCKLFNAVKRYGGYDKVVTEKKWADVFRFVRPGIRISECAKHVLSQLYREHLYDYERHYNKLNNGKVKCCRKRTLTDKEEDQGSELTNFKRRRKNSGEIIKISSPQELEHDQICENCKSGLHGEVMLLCDRCNKGWHIYCLSPPLETIPPGNWYCFECLSSNEDAFGFVPGKKFSLEAFRRAADRTKRKWFGSASCSRTQLEKKFWEIVEGSLGEVEVMYGSDLDTSIYGSGFPRLHDPKSESVEAGLWDEYCASPWNLNNLPKLKGSMLRAVHHNIAGVMVPWLYIGMLFSAFCWHFEDHCFYSMNYHHWGEPKCWYSVPGSEASSFEKVMRNCLPDLFDAQPDLLFQLVTMLNPSVLQDNGVPVYTVLQEPGNFVITFPRSYHGGFNLGLNCAEAVNFAPADWLPHGGFGAELYQLYHKAAVLSHEELLCVVAKSDLDSSVAPYLNKELQRIFSKERTWRGQLWKKGVIKTSVMPPRKHPEYVGTEEDPTCIICEQYLYLSAVSCRCRPKTFVCLEHWERLCECNPRKRRLLYRHSLAELSELLVITDDHHFTEMRQSRSLKKQSSLCNSLSTLKKKVKGKNVSLCQHAEQWLMSSRKLLQLPFSGEAYGKALRQANQFIWAGPEMDSVRELVKSLTEAKNWAESIQNCLSNVQKWRDCGHTDLPKMQLEHVLSLLVHDSPLCNEPGHLKLKEYAEAAVVLIHDICAALLKLPVSISHLENVHRRATEFPIHVKETEELSSRISLIKAWINSVRKCALEKFSAAVDIEALLNLKVEMLEHQLDFPESEMLMALIEKTECCQTRCSEMLKRCVTLKELELLIRDYESFPVDIPELKLLRKHYSDAISWISRFNEVLSGIEDREDLESAIAELNSLKVYGALLNVQVDECNRMDIELRRMSCRTKASQACTAKKPLDFFKQVLAEAVELQINNERQFIRMSEVLTSAMCWEEQAKQVLLVEGSLCDYENSIRASLDIHAILPSLPDVQDALSAAKMWLQTSEPFLQAVDSNRSVASLLSYEALKEHVHKSTLLRVSLAERTVTEMLLKRCEEWRCTACTILKDVDELLNSIVTGNEMINGLVFNIDKLNTGVERATADSSSLGFTFPESSNLQAAHSTLQWCSKLISFISLVAPHKEVISLYEAARDIPTMYSSSFLLASLIDGVTWLKRASEILSLTREGVRSFYVADAEDALADSQRYAISFSAVVGELETAIKKHKHWLQNVHLFMSIDSAQQPWSSFFQLKELGETDAFSCPELNYIISEYEEIEKWKLCCEEHVVGSRDEDTLVNSLLKIKKSLHRSLYIYEKLSGGNVRYYCTGCSNRSDEEDFIACSFCKDWYHHKCLVPNDADGNIIKDYTCPYCLLVQNGSIRQSKDSPLKYEGKRPKLERLTELLSDAQKFCVRVEERVLLQDIVDQALACRKCLSEIVDSALASTDRDLSSISQRLTIPLKALDVVGVYDQISREKFDKALARNSWRVRAHKLLEGSQKPWMHQLQQHLKEASTIDVPSEDYFRQKLLQLKQIASAWVETAKKVAGDNGELPLDQVYDLIIEGQNLPVRFEKELKLLRDRSTLYCICRKPYDNRSAMIACDHCQEWYHFDCVNVASPLPKVYTCPACETLQIDRKGCFPSNSELEGLAGVKTSEPKTPSPRHTQSLWKHNKRPHHKLSRQLKKGETGSGSCSKQTSSTGVAHLFWSNRRPFSRVSKKRLDLGSLVSLLNL